MRNCLIVIDLQNDFLSQLDGESCVALIRKTNELIRIFRESGCSIIWVKQIFRPDLSDAFLEMRDRQVSIAIDGTQGAEIHSDLARNDEDPVIVKKRYSAFFGTNLERVLNDLNLKQVTIAGVNTHACIRTTAIDAYQRDLRVLLASECIDSYDPEHARISMAYMDKKIALAMTNEQISDGLV